MRVQAELDRVREQVEVEKDRIKKLKSRAEFIMMELRRKQQFHVDVGGRWEGAWVPFGKSGDAVVAGLTPNRFVRRWTCCDCTNKNSVYCKPFCGCGVITEHFCEGAPVPPPNSTLLLHPVVAARLQLAPHPLYHKIAERSIQDEAGDDD